MTQIGEEPASELQRLPQLRSLVVELRVQCHNDMQFIRMIAKKVTVFNQGAVLVEDEVENIMRNPIVRDIYLGKQAAA